MTPTQMVELRSEIVRKQIVMERLALPNEQRASRLVAGFLVLGLFAAFAVAYFFVGAL